MIILFSELKRNSGSGDSTFDRPIILIDVAEPNKKSDQKLQGYKPMVPIQLVCLFASLSLHNKVCQPLTTCFVNTFSNLWTFSC